MYKSYTLLLLLAGCLTLSSAIATPLDPNRAYQVEIIAFKHQNTIKTKRPESFSHYPALPNIEASHALLGYSKYPSLYSAVPSSKMRLNREADRIADNPDYTLLIHDAWYQEEGFSRLLRLSNISDENDNTPYHLDGTIKVTKGLYYYVNLDLLLPPNFTLKVTRRVRKDEIHYIDHPEYGVLVLIHPLSQKKA